ncbi:MAG: hypothetical protein IIZ39_00580 [Blautia sp.]|nr:hypothetical protein [Blautia sp.]
MKRPFLRLTITLLSLAVIFYIPHTFGQKELYDHLSNTMCPFIPVPAC